MSRLLGARISAILCPGKGGFWAFSYPRIGPPGRGREQAAERKGKKKSQTACKPGSVPATENIGARRWPFIWDARYRTPRATYPGGGAETRLPENLRLAAPTWSCSRWGLPCHPRCRGRGALLPHPFTLARAGPRAGASAVCFLWHFPWGCPRRALPGTVFPWSPDFPPHPGKPGQGSHPAVWQGLN